MKAEVGDVLAIRPGRESDSDSDESDDDAIIDDGDLFADYWLAVVRQPYKTYDIADPQTHPAQLHSLVHDDEYVVIEYLHYVCDTAQGGRKYVTKQGYPCTVFWQQGAIVPYKMNKSKMTKKQTTFILTEAHEDNVLCRLQPITD